MFVVPSGTARVSAYPFLVSTKTDHIHSAFKLRKGEGKPWGMRNEVVTHTSPRSFARYPAKTPPALSYPAATRPLPRSPRPTPSPPNHPSSGCLRPGIHKADQDRCWQRVRIHGRAGRRLQSVGISFWLRDPAPVPVTV